VATGFSSRPLRKLGKLPPKHDVRTLRLGEVLDPSQLPSLPASVDPAALPGWLMLLNDRLGCCAVAGPYHAIMQWLYLLLGAIFKPADADVQADYSAISGYDPDAPLDSDGENPTDTGCAMLDVMKYGRTHGFAAGQHKYNAFAAVRPGNEEHVKAAVAWYGACVVGMALPPIVVEQDLDVWDGSGPDWQPDPRMGHCVVILGYHTDPDGVLWYTICSWGKLIKMSARLFERCGDEGFAVFDLADWTKGGKAPNGLLVDQLRNLLRKVTA
jgi:hypothetical protein